MAIHTKKELRTKHNLALRGGHRVLIYDEEVETMRRRCSRSRAGNLRGRGIRTDQGRVHTYVGFFKNTVPLASS